MKKKKKNSPTMPMYTIQCPYPDCQQTQQIPIGSTYITCAFCNRPIQLKQPTAKQPPIPPPPKLQDKTPSELSHEQIQRAIDNIRAHNQPNLPNPTNLPNNTNTPNNPNQQYFQQPPPQQQSPYQNVHPIPYPQDPVIQQQMPYDQQKQAYNPSQQQMSGVAFNEKREIARDVLRVLRKAKMMSGIALIMPILMLFLGIMFLDLIGMAIYIVSAVYIIFILRGLTMQSADLQTRYQLGRPRQPLRRRIQPQPYHQQQQPQWDIRHPLNLNEQPRGPQW